MIEYRRDSLGMFPLITIFFLFQGCVCIENMETLILQAPKDSFALKSNERGIGQATHKFTFSQVWRNL